MKPFAWSYSALTTYELCPKKYYHLNVAKDVKDADSSFAADGKVVHDAMKKRVVDGIALPLNMRHYEKMAARFATAPGTKHGEMKLALNRRFEPVDFFAPDVWVRTIIDLAVEQTSHKRVIIVDWKTGKVKDDPTQMSLCAAVVSRWMPEATEFRTAFAWLQSGTFTLHNFKLNDMPGIWSGLLPRVQKIEEARKTTTFPAKPNPLCRGYCPVKECPHFQERE